MTTTLPALHLVPSAQDHARDQEATAHAALSLDQLATVAEWAKDDLSDPAQELTYRERRARQEAIEHYECALEAAKARGEA